MTCRNDETFQILNLNNRPDDWANWKNFYVFFSFVLWSSTEKIGIFEVIYAHWDQFDPIEIINRETNTVSG